MISGGFEEVGAFGWMEAVEQGPDARDEAIDGSCWFVSQQRLELGERHLDGVQIRAVGRQVEELGAAPRDSLADAGDPVGWQVVEHDNIAAFEGRAEDLMDVDPEGISIHWPVEHPWRGHAAEAQSGDECHGLPVTERDSIVAALSDRRPAIEAGHLGVDPGLVEEDEALRVDERLCRLPQRPPRGDVGAILLGCAQGFF